MVILLTERWKQHSLLFVVRAATSNYFMHMRSLKPKLFSLLGSINIINTFYGNLPFTFWYFTCMLKWTIGRWCSVSSLVADFWSTTFISDFLVVCLCPLLKKQHSFVRWDIELGLDWLGLSCAQAKNSDRQIATQMVWMSWMQLYRLL